MEKFFSSLEKSSAPPEFEEVIHLMNTVQCRESGEVLLITLIKIHEVYLLHMLCLIKIILHAT